MLIVNFVGVVRGFRMSQLVVVPKEGPAWWRLKQGNACGQRARLRQPLPLKPRIVARKLLARPLCRNVPRMFEVQILEDFAGIFPEDSSGHLLPQKWGEKSGDKIREKLRQPKKKDPRKIRSAKTDSKNWSLKIFYKKQQVDLLKCSSPYFSRVFCPGMGFSEAAGAEGDFRP